jgi:hypothetical protein
MTDPIDPRDRFILHSGEGRIIRDSSELTIEEKERILVELDLGIPKEQSKVRQSPEAAAFREREGRLMAEAKKHPKYHMVLPEI